MINEKNSKLYKKFGRGFLERNLQQMRLFYSLRQKSQTLSAEFIDPENWQTLSAESKIKIFDLCN